MLPAIQEEHHPTMETVEELFDQWRKKKKFRDPIPPVLWEAALSLADSHPVYAIAKRLRLNYTNLKALAVRSARGTHDGPPLFVELGPVTRAVACTIELTKPTGERMTITGNCTVGEIVREFLR